MRKWFRGVVVAGLIGLAREDILLHDDVRTKPLQLMIDSVETHEDPYLTGIRHACYGYEPWTFDCVKYSLLQRLEGFLSGEHRLGDHARLVKSTRVIDHEQSEGRSLSGLAGYLARKAWEFAATTDLVLEFPKELTGGDVMAPRFIDEVFHEFDTIDNKHEKPQIRNQLKKLFIPLLIILKIFKLKLLFLLPLILGVASFKKLIGFLAILIPGVIGYLKLCRSGFDYGAHGHSNYYNRPPHRRHGLEYDLDDNTFEPYSPEFANVHPDYLPDYLQESTANKRPNENKYYKKQTDQPANNQYYKGSNQITQGYLNNQGLEFAQSSQSQQQNAQYHPQNEQYLPQNTQRLSQKENSWKTQSDYLPYRGYYKEYVHK